MRSLSHTKVGARKQTRANKGDGQGGGGEGSKLGNLERTYFLNVPKCLDMR